MYIPVLVSRCPRALESHNAMQVAAVFLRLALLGSAPQTADIQEVRVLCVQIITDVFPAKTGNVIVCAASETNKQCPHNCGCAVHGCF